MAGAAGQHEQMPDSVEVAEPLVEYALELAGFGAVAPLPRPAEVRRLLSQAQ